jgi:hypothetical protein
VSALPPKAAAALADRHARCGPKADCLRCANQTRAPTTLPFVSNWLAAIYSSNTSLGVVIRMVRIAKSRESDMSRWTADYWMGVAGGLMFGALIGVMVTSHLLQRL